MSLLFDDSADRTEQPTQRRRRDARAQGHVARSAELLTAVRTFALWGAISSWVGVFVIESSDWLRTSLSQASMNPSAAASGNPSVMPASWGLSQLALPLGLVTVFVVIAHFSQIGWLWQPSHAFPNLDRISPAAGIRRITSTALSRGLLLSAKSLALLGLAAWLLPSTFASQIVSDRTSTSSPLLNEQSSHKLSDVAGLSSNSRKQIQPRQASPTAVHLVGINDWLQPFRRFSLSLSLSLIAWGIGDYLWQRRRFERSLRMTKSEVLREQKETSSQRNPRWR